MPGGPSDRPGHEGCLIAIRTDLSDRLVCLLVRAMNARLRSLPTAGRGHFPGGFARPLRYSPHWGRHVMWKHSRDDRRERKVRVGDGCYPDKCFTFCQIL